MEFTLQQIADYLNGTVEGDGALKVSELSKIEEGRPGTLTFLSNPKYIQYIYTTQATACLVNNDFVAEQPLTTVLIRVDNAYESLAKLLTLVDSIKPKKQGVSAKSDIDVTAKLGENVYVGAFVVIGANVEIGNNVKIYANTVIDDGVVVGDDTVIYAGVKIYEGCRVGSRCVLHAGSVVGSDGFGHAPDGEGHYHKIPQIGNVVIEDDVELGANTTVDRATMGSTVIRRGVKIDNLVQVAHNVEIGEDTVIAAQSGIAGSTKIGRRCMLGGQVGISGHITIADGSIFGAQSGVPSTIKEPNQIWQGYPAMPIMGFRKLNVLQRQLPDLARKVYDLEKKLK
jgi:UDP-3-O-[3-hydroxymyristoyl] glucosamine N-acyltransferase